MVSASVATGEDVDTVSVVRESLQRNFNSKKIKRVNASFDALLSGKELQKTHEDLDGARQVTRQSYLCAYVWTRELFSL